MHSQRQLLSGIHNHSVETVYLLGDVDSVNVLAPHAPTPALQVPVLSLVLGCTLNSHIPTRKLSKDVVVAQVVIIPRGPSILQNLAQRDTLGILAVHKLLMLLHDALELGDVLCMVFERLITKRLPIDRGSLICRLGIFP